MVVWPTTATAWAHRRCAATAPEAAGHPWALNAQSSRAWSAVAATSTSAAKKILNGKVAMPICSSRRWNRDGHEGVLGDGYGRTTCLLTQEVDPLVCRQGVYFMKMYVKRKRLDNKGFGRHGIN